MNRLIKHTVFVVCLLLAGASQAFAFCGFYVAKADATLFNESSQVILARSGDKITVTMSNDFKGDVSDFAMVVPVPVILQEEDIKVVNTNIFTRFDTYSGPRLVEYWDQNPCQQRYSGLRSKGTRAMTGSAMMDREMPEENERNSYHVTVEAEYTVGEYDIVILSAKESDGLERWLTDNGYKIPEKAGEVLKPYIRDKMKFFVVKVNMERHAGSGFQTLNPLQISYESDRFMLPIRLGMANAKADQDLVIYTLTERGRVETTNYRTVKIPTDREIPEFVKERFGEFYVDLFKKAWKRSGKNVAMLEYAWDLSSKNFTKCDPCATTPPTYQELAEAGVDWVRSGSSGRWSGANYTGDVFFTRLHVRYNRSTFPQDLVFHETSNKNHFQGRYIMNHPARGTLDCENARGYLKKLIKRRKGELAEMKSLAGWRVHESSTYVSKYEKMLAKLSGNDEIIIKDEGNGSIDRIPDHELDAETPDDDLVIRDEAPAEENQIAEAKATSPAAKKWLFVGLFTLGAIVVARTLIKPNMTRKA